VRLGRHRGQAAQACPAQSLQQEGLSLVVGVMTQQQRGRSGSIAEFEQGRITCGACSRLDTLPGAIAQIDTLGCKTRPRSRRDIACMIEPCIGMCAETVMNMKSDAIRCTDYRACGIEQHGRVQATAECNR
jgi:hypothetical protein